MKYWEIIADHLSKAGWSWGCSTQAQPDGSILNCVDAHLDDGRRFIVRADEKLTAFLALEEQVRAQVAEG